MVKKLFCVALFALNTLFTCGVLYLSVISNSGFLAVSGILLSLAHYSVICPMWGSK